MTAEQELSNLQRTLIRKWADRTNGRPTKKDKKDRNALLRLSARWRAMVATEKEN